MNYFRQRI